MKKCYGITEPFWSSLSEDHRLVWKYVSRSIGLVAALLMALLVLKTGNIFIDWALTAATTVFLMIAVETQRSYSKLSPRMRKANIRLLIFLGSWGIAFIGIAYFSQAAFVASARVLAQDVLPAVGRSRHAIFSLGFLAISIACVPIAVIRVIRQLSIEELIYHLPQRGLKDFFIRRPYKATSFAMFAYTELMFMMICLVYTSAMVTLIKSFLFLVATFSGE